MNVDFWIFALLILAFISFIFFIFYIVFESDEDRKKKKAKKQVVEVKHTRTPMEREDKKLELKKLYAEKYIWAVNRFGIDFPNETIHDDPEENNFWLWSNVIVIGKSINQDNLAGQAPSRYRYPNVIEIVDTVIGSTKCCEDADAPTWVYQFMVDFIKLIDKYDSRLTADEAAEYDELKIDYRNLLTMGDRFKHNAITLESITEY